MSVVSHARAVQGVASVVETENHRFLIFDDQIIGCEHRDVRVRDQMAFSAMALMATLAFLVPTPSRVLCLGLGAGTVPHYLRMQGIHTDVIEIDEGVIRLAEEYFLFGMSGAGASGGGTVIHGDALDILSQAPPHGRYDVVLSDLWSGYNEGRALNAAFFARIRDAWLREGGVLAINLVAFAEGPHAALARDVARTLASVYASVRVYAEFDPHEPDGPKDALEPANLLLLASDAASSLRHAPPSYVAVEDAMDDDVGGGSPEPGSMHHVFERFEAWQPSSLAKAVEGLDGRVLRTRHDWDALQSERAAVARGMREQQRELLPREAWAAVAELIDEAEETPPRRVGRAPPSAVKEEL